MQATENDELLMGEFPPSNYNEWRKAAEALLKGAPFDKLMLKATPEGIVTQPIYHREDVEGGAADLPGLGDFVRGTRPEGYLETAWEIAQELEESDPVAFNASARADLARGQTALNAVVADADSNRGLRLRRSPDLATALEGIDPCDVPLHFQAGLSGLALEAVLLAWMRSTGTNLEKVRGSLNMDPVGRMAESGALPSSLEALLDELHCLARFNSERLPGFRAVGVSGFPYHNAGASAVEELAAMMATGVYYIRQLVERGSSVDAAASQIRFSVPIGGDFFMEVAKFRVARQLWSRIVRALGGSDSAAAIVVHARTGLFNKTRRDPYVNMLRTTTEALSAIVGGVDSLCVGTFDEILRPPSQFARRIARNTQIILKEECDLPEVVDPAGGSWYLESLTDQLARKSWSVFQKIEGEGGIVAALQSGFLQALISPKLEDRKKQLGQRRTTLVGTNKYPNVDETPLSNGFEESPEKPGNQETDTSEELPLSPIALDEPGALLRLSDDAASGASFGRLLASVRSAAAEGERCQPLTSGRLAESYEALRDAAEAREAETGKRPSIFLANLGPLRRHKARADFSRAFFEVGGFHVESSAGFQENEKLVDAVSESGAPIVVICGHDEDYEARLVEVIGAIRGRGLKVKIVLAGFPGEREAAYREAGLDDFIFVKSDNYAVNRDYLQELGVIDSSN